MTNRWLATLVACAGLALFGGPAAASDLKPSIKQVDMSRFPTVAVTVTGSDLDPQSINLLEDGHGVADLNITSLEKSGQGVDVVLALDASLSMKGEPFEAAIRAATAFIEQLPPATDVGIVRFHDDAKVVLPVTTDRDAALGALDELELGRGTALYDAVDVAAGMFSSNDQRNIVVLSDGADVRSESTLREAADAAKRADATVYTVGLRGRGFKESALRQLATLNGGTYVPVGMANLETLYESFAEQLSTQVVLTYETDSRRGREVRITIVDPNGEDNVVLLTPEIDVTEIPAAPPEAPPVAPPSISLKGPIGLALMLGVTFAAVFMIMVLLVGHNTKARRDKELARRMGAIHEVPVKDGAESDGGIGSWLPDGFVEMAERMADGSEFGSGISRKLERAGLAWTTGEFVAASAALGLIATTLGGLLFGNALMALFLGGMGVVGPHAFVGMTLRRRFGKLQGQLADILMILASSLRAGHSFMQALDAVAKEVGGPGAQEFGRVVSEIQLGRPSDEALSDLADRIGSPDFRWAVLAVNIQRDVGGNLAEVLDTVAETMREREGVRRQVKVLSTEGRISMYILGALPIVLALYMAVVNPTYLALLFTTRMGVWMLATGACLLVAGILWMRKVVRIHV